MVVNWRRFYDRDAQGQMHSVSQRLVDEYEQRLDELRKENEVCGQFLAINIWLSSYCTSGVRIRRLS